MPPPAHFYCLSKEKPGIIAWHKRMVEEYEKGVDNQRGAVIDFKSNDREPISSSRGGDKLKGI